MKKSAILFIAILCVAEWSFAQNYCMRFFGHGTGDIDRVKIPINNPEKPVDVAYDFTLEFELKAALSENPLGGNASAGFNDDWILGHIVIDRDIFGQGDYGDFGVSLAAGRVAFGVNNGGWSYTLIGATMIADSYWHHVALVRNSNEGKMYIFIDGQLDAFFNDTPTGNISYRNNRTTSYPNDPYIVLGAEKHDYDNSTYPSFSGYLDELRISDVQRYTSAFLVPLMPFLPDANTRGLYHFNEGSGASLLDVAGVAGSPSNGTVNYGGASPAGPLWVLRSSPPTGLWSGNISSDWFVPGNWDDLQVPLATTNVTLPGGRPNYPEISGSLAICNNLLVNAGSNILVPSGASLVIAGDLTIQGIVYDQGLLTVEGNVICQ